MSQETNRYKKMKKRKADEHHLVVVLQVELDGLIMIIFVSKKTSQHGHGLETRDTYHQAARRLSLFPILGNCTIDTVHAFNMSNTLVFTLCDLTPEVKISFLA